MIRTERGSSLVEVMFAILLLGVAGVVFAASFPAGFSSLRQSDEYSKASFIAQKKLEQIKALEYAQVNYASLTEKDILDEGTDAMGRHKFTTIDQLASTLPTGTGALIITQEANSVKRVDVIVGWRGTGAGEINRSLTYTTLVSNTTPWVHKL